MIPDKKISDFIKKHHVMTLATSEGGKPWCSNIFYAYDPERNLFVFTSDDHTVHARQAALNPTVAASIVLETRTVGKVQGLQLTGKMRRPEDEGHRYAKKLYLKSFPYAAVMDLTLWILEPDHFKLTDNRLGFGKKLIWNKNGPQ